jgi:hypothetical protein
VKAFRLTHRLDTNTSTQYASEIQLYSSTGVQETVLTKMRVRLKVG